MASSTIVVNNNGVELNYHDSGAPQDASQYTTIFAIHGTAFSSPIFQKMIDLAPSSGIRFVAITRRHYPGSTPLSKDELDVLSSGKEEQKNAYLTARGLEIVTFIDKFIEQHSLPSISQDGRSGGIVILGWSMGNSMSLAAVSNLDLLPEDVCACVALRLRALIMHEPAWIILGLPTPEKNWAPLVDTSIPIEARVPMFIQWVTSYFKHQEGFLESRSLDSLEYVVPATFCVPSIFNMSALEHATIVAPASVASDFIFVGTFGLQLLANYHKAVFARSVRKLAPSMRVYHLYGDSSHAFAPATFWQVEDDDKARGGGFVEGKMVPGGNHFMHWDKPELTLRAILDILKV